MMKTIGKAIPSANSEISAIALHILPPVLFRSSSLTDETQTLLEQGGAVVGGFLEAWTKRVGDPVISKWIVVVLGVSMSLNAWLLNAARRGAMQPPVISTRPLQAPNVSKTEPKLATPSTSVSQANGNSNMDFRKLDDEESDDKEKRGAAVKRSVRSIRSINQCMDLLTEGRPSDLLDEEVIALALQKKIPLYALEKTLKDVERAVKVRRAVVCTPPI
jgi:hydroxymethylglutaryl-CoA reductase (NADPH)